MGFYSVNSQIQDGKRRGVRFLPVSVLHSSDQTTVISDSEVRLGLLRLKGLTRETAARLADERLRGPFSSLQDFLARCQPNQKERRLLAKAGALNDLPAVRHRRDGLWQLEQPLYGDLLPTETPKNVLPAERLAADYTTQGASAGPHPMRLWRDRHPEPRLPRAVDLVKLPHGFPIRIAGMVICRQLPGTAKVHCFISLEDETGIANLFVPKKTFHTNRLVITAESFLLAEGRIQIGEGEQATVYVTAIHLLHGRETAHASSSHDFH